MPLVRLPNGEYADFEEGTPQSVIDAVSAQHKPKAGGPLRVNIPAPFKDQEKPKSAESRMNDAVRSIPLVGNAIAGINETGSDFNTAFTKGLTFSASDELAGVAGQKEAERERQRVAQERSPTASVIGEIAGALFNPIGTGAKGLQMAGKLIPGLGKAGKALASTGAVRQGIAAGALQGGLNSAGAATGNVLERVDDAATGAAMGGAMGGVMGGAGVGMDKVASGLRDSAPANATSTAYARIAGLLEKGRKTPERVAREVALGRAAGNETMVADVLPSLQAQAAYIARKPNISASNDIINDGVSRMSSRADRLNERLTKAIQPKTGTDAIAAKEGISGTRKAVGNVDYEDLFDIPVPVTDEINAVLKRATDNPLVKQAMDNAHKYMAMEDLPVGQMKHVLTLDDGTKVFDAIPDIKTLDYMKRGFNKVISDAKRSGDGNMARLASKQFEDLKAAVGNATDGKYNEVLGRQADLFQQEQGVEFGQTIVKRLSGAGSDPKGVLKEWDDNIKPEHLEHVRTGIVNELLALGDRKGNPVLELKRMIDSPNKRKVLERAFGGRGNLGRFQRWIGREMKTLKTDSMTAGNQSITSLVRGAELADEAAGAGNAALAVQGLLNNSPIQAMIGGGRFVANKARGMSDEAYEEIARILMGGGDDLVKGIGATKALTGSRAIRRAEVARKAAKGSQQTITSVPGE